MYRTSSQRGQPQNSSSRGTSSNYRRQEDPLEASTDDSMEDIDITRMQKPRIVQPISSSSSSVRQPPPKSQPPPPTGERRIDVDAVRKVVSSRAYSNRIGSNENMNSDEQLQQSKTFGQPKAFVPKDVSGSGGGGGKSFSRPGGGSSGYGGGGMVSSTAHSRDLNNNIGGNKSRNSNDDRDDRRRGCDDSDADDFGVGVSESSWLAKGPRKFLGSDEPGGVSAAEHQDRENRGVALNRNGGNHSKQGSRWKDAHPSPQHSIHSDGTGSNPNSPTQSTLQQQQEDEQQIDDAGDIKDTDYFESTFHKLSVPKADFIVSKDNYNPPALAGKENRLSDLDDMDDDMPADGSSEVPSPEKYAVLSVSLGLSSARKSGRYSDSPHADGCSNGANEEEDETVEQFQERSMRTQGGAPSSSGPSSAYDGSLTSPGDTPGLAGQRRTAQSPTDPHSTNAMLATAASSHSSFVLLAHPRGLRTNHVQCTVRRDRSSMQGKLYPTYEMILEEPRQTIIVARKMNLNVTSNYHLFDMTRGMAGKKLSKKAGNYLGKLRARNSDRTEYVLLNQSSDREELAGIIFDRMTMYEQVREGNQPRKLKAMLPHVNNTLLCEPYKTGLTSLVGKLISAQDKPDSVDKNLHYYVTKDPVFENGNYRLNFNGRVSLPSVKNFQMVSPDNIDDVVCQFGKVNEDVFHLDYKYPFNAVQALSLALCQFNL